MILYEKREWSVQIPMMPNFVKAVRIVANQEEERSIPVGDLSEQEATQLAEEMKQEFLLHCEKRRRANQVHPAPKP